MDSKKAAEVVRGLLESLIFTLGQVPAPVHQLQKVYPLGSADELLSTGSASRKDRKKASATSKLIDQLESLEKHLADAISVEYCQPLVVLLIWGSTVTTPKATFIIQLPALLPSQPSVPPTVTDSSTNLTPADPHVDSVVLSHSPCATETPLATQLRVSGQPTSALVSNSLSDLKRTFNGSSESRACARWIMEHLTLQELPVMPLHVLLNIHIPTHSYIHAQQFRLGAWQPRQAISTLLDSLAFIPSRSLSASTQITCRTAVGLAIATDGSPHSLETRSSLSLLDTVWLSWKERIHGFTD